MGENFQIGLWSMPKHGSRSYERKHQKKKKNENAKGLGLNTKN